nr:uncharacterized protein LOC109757664 [Aegilops tauschii subsp. strangulata]
MIRLLILTDIAGRPWILHVSTLLKATAGRPKTERYKGCGEKKKRKSGQHLCPICKDYGHHWHKFKKGNPDDIAAILAVRGPPKKRIKTTKSAQSSIVPCEDDAPSAMCFPPSQILEKQIRKKGKVVNLGPGGAKRSRTQPICGEHDVANKKIHVAVNTRSKRRLSL